MTDTVTAPPTPPAPPARSSRAPAVLGLVLLAATAVFGADPAGVRERLLGAAAPEARPAATGRAAAGATATSVAAGEGTRLRSQPWWQAVTTLRGTGTMSPAPFTVDAGALQWRARWSCQSGHLRVEVPGARRPIVDAACPGSDTGYGVQKGPVTLRVTADGPWELQVDQQIDLPLNEAPLPAMSAPGAAKVASGTFYRIDQFGDGQATVYRLPDDRYALRLDNFYVTPNTDLEIRLQSLAAPHSTDQVAGDGSIASVSPLDVTAGSMNFLLPADVNPARYHSVVIWCERLFSAYTAATLTPAG